MKITLTPTESEEYFYNALCNGLGYLRQYGIELDYNDNEYYTSRSKLGTPTSLPSYEDVFMQMLRDGYKLTFTDTEYGMDPVGITIKDVHEKVQNTPLRHLMDMVNENDDADTADVILQTVLYNEIIFG